MDTKIIDQVKSDIEDGLSQLEALAAEDDFDPSSQEVAELQRSIDSKQGRLATLTEAVKSRQTLESTNTSLSRAVARRDDTTKALQSTSIGDIFTRSRQFEQYDGFGKSSRVETGITGDMLRRAVTLPIMNADLAGTYAAPPQYLAAPPMLTPLLNLIRTVQTAYDTVPVWSAARGADAGAAVVAEGADKPNVDIDFTTTTVTLDTVAVWTQATRQALEDVPMLRSMIDTILRNDVIMAFEKEAVGALNSATLPTSASVAGTTLVHAIRGGIAEVQSAGYTPNVVLISPANAAAIDIAQIDLKCCDADSYFGLQAIPVPGLTTDEAIVGDATNGLVTYERSAGVSVYISDSHAATFIANVFTILAEARRKTVVQRPDAFARVSVTP